MQGKLWFQGNVMLRPGCFTSMCVSWAVPEAGVLHSAEMRVQKRGDRILGRIFFFFCPENRPWFPGTMQLMRASPRKIRLWHHGFLKHTAEPTLSCYNQVSVNFHCWLKLRERESPILKLYMVFLNTFFNLAANILELAPCSCTLHCIWLAVAIKLHTGLLVNFS